MRKLDALRRETALVFLLMIIAFAARLLPGPRTIDDAYITFRYARNIVAGNGFVYNTGERVLGTTTPLYTALMAAEAGLAGRRDPATGLAGGFPELALLTNALADALCVWLLYRLGRRLGNGTLVGAALAACWAIHPLSVTFAIGGMETSVFVALTLATLAAYLDDRWRMTGALAALALLTRPEALIVIGLLTLDVAARFLRHAESGRNMPIAGGMAAFALVLTPWVIFATLSFGSPIPGSILAKGVAYQLASSQALAAFLRTLVVPFSGVGDFGPAIGLMLLAVYGALFAVGAWGAIRNEARSWPLFAFAGVYIALYVAANPLIFRWYVIPPLPIVLLGIVLGVKKLVGALRQPRLASIVLTIASVAVVAAAAGGWWMPDHGPASIAPRMAYIKLELTYLEAAERLRGAVNPNTVIAAGDIGAMGYATGARIYDTLGLITPEARLYYPVPPEAIVPSLPYAIPTQLILDAEPDVVVILEAYGRNTFLRDPDFQRQYTRIDTLVSGATQDYDSAGMYLFVRRP